MNYPTQRVGDATAVQKRVISTQNISLLAVIGRSTGALDGLFIQIHETAAEPAANAVPAIDFPIDLNRPFSFALPTRLDLSACTIVASTTAGTYTAAAGTPVTIQAIIRA